MPGIEELTLAADPGRWLDAGFHVSGGLSQVGRCILRLAGPDTGRGIAGWSLAGVTALDLDGLPTRRARNERRRDPAPVHPNGVLRLDHVVAFSPNLERTIAALEAAGLAFRRLREGPTPTGALRQAFFRLGDDILEVVEHPPGTLAADGEAPAHFYGLAFLVEDIGAAAEAMGAHLGEVREAVQPGRQIATVSRDAGLGLPVAVMTPRPDSRAGQAE